MRSIFQVIIFAVSICLLTSRTEGQTVRRENYVDFNYTGKQTGSASKPFNTLSSALAVSKMGDSIYIKEGVYTVTQHNYRDFEIRNFTPEGDCTVDDDTQMATITVDTKAKNSVVFNGSGNFPDTSLIEIVDSRCICLDGSEKMIIDGSSANLSRTKSLLSIYSYRKNIRDIVVKNLVVRNSSGRGISYRQQVNSDPANIKIRNNKIYNIDHRAVGGFGNTLFIEGNEIWEAAMSNKNQSYGSSGWPGVIQTARRYDDNSRSYHYSRNILVYNNRIYDSWGEGIIMNFTHSGEIRRNRIHDVFSVYVYIDSSKDIVVNGNHLYRTKDTYDRKDKSTNQANGISFSVEAYEWGMGQEPSKLENILISNNLIDNLGKGVSFWHDGACRFRTNSYKNILIFHNILRNLHSTPLYIAKVPDGYDRPANGQFKNNIVENTSIDKVGTFDIGDPGYWILSHNNWAGGMSVESNHSGSHDKSPGFLGSDFHIGCDPINFQLMERSTNIHTGIGTIVREDFWENSRDSERPSIGIHEYIKGQ